MEGKKGRKKKSKSGRRTKALEMRNDLNLQPDQREVATSEAWESGREIGVGGVKT